MKFMYINIQGHIKDFGYCTATERWMLKVCFHSGMIFKFKLNICILYVYTVYMATHRNSEAL